MQEREIKIREGIHSTLAFFALFDKPLTRDEVLQYFYTEDNDLIDEIRQSAGTVQQWVEEVLQSDPEIDEHQGQYFLKRHHYEMLDERLHTKLLKKCQRYLPLLQALPFVRMVALGNTLAFGAADDDSDIDLFIIVEKNYLWLSRAIVTFFLHVLGVRRHGSKTAERFCLSFYIDTEVQDLSQIMIDQQDIYLRFWTATLKPIWGRTQYKAFVAHNEVLLHHFPFWDHRAEEVYMMPVKTLYRWIQKFQEFDWKIWPFTLLAKFIKSLQKRKMQFFPVQQTVHASVVISDHMLKFHNNDRRGRYQEQWEKLKLVSY